MTINIEHEDLLTFSQAARYLPKRNGKSVHGTTLWRWAVHGHKGIKLEALRTPSGWFTTVAAVQRFLVLLANQNAQETAALKQQLEEEAAVKARKKKTREILERFRLPVPED